MDTSHGSRSRWLLETEPMPVGGFVWDAFRGRVGTQCSVVMSFLTVTIQSPKRWKNGF